MVLCGDHPGRFPLWQGFYSWCQNHFFKKRIKRNRFKRKDNKKMLWATVSYKSTGWLSWCKDNIYILNDCLATYYQCYVCILCEVWQKWDVKRESVQEKIVHLLRNLWETGRTECAEAQRGRAFAGNMMKKLLLSVPVNRHCWRILLFALSVEGFFGKHMKLKCRGMRPK